MAQAEERMCTQDLFGGAAKMSLPERLVDVADFRQVPNNQEASGSHDVMACMQRNWQIKRQQWPQPVS